MANLICETSAAELGLSVIVVVAVISDLVSTLMTGAANMAMNRPTSKMENKPH